MLLNVMETVNGFLRSGGLGSQGEDSIGKRVKSCKV